MIIENDQFWYIILGDAIVKYYETPQLKELCTYFGISYESIRRLNSREKGQYIISILAKRRQIAQFTHYFSETGSNPWSKPTSYWAIIEQLDNLVMRADAAYESGNPMSDPIYLQELADHQHAKNDQLQFEKESALVLDKDTSQRQEASSLSARSFSELLGVTLIIILLFVVFYAVYGLFY